MAGPFVTASNLGRALKCPASVVLPQAPREPSPTRDAAAALGTAYHRFAETGEIDPSLTRGHQARLAGLDREALWPAGGEHEVAYGYDVVTRKVVQMGTGREAYAGNPDVPDTVVAGTADFVAEGHVDDLKTSRYMRADWDQLEFLGAVAGELQDAEEMTLTTTFIPASPQSAPPTREAKAQTREERRAFLGEMGDLYGKVLVARLQLAAGGPGGVSVNPEESRCRFCAARASCPNPAPLPEKQW